MQITNPRTATMTPAPEPAFTGDVRIGGFVRHPAPSSMVTAVVTFAPGARTPWKTNTCGQTLLVIEGAGRAQEEGQTPSALHPGDVATFAPGVRHWDGAAPDQPMTAVVFYDGDVTFHDPVLDDTYHQLDQTPTP